MERHTDACRDGSRIDGAPCSCGASERAAREADREAGCTPDEIEARAQLRASLIGAAYQAHAARQRDAETLPVGIYRALVRDYLRMTEERDALENTLSEERRQRDAIAEELARVKRTLELHHRIADLGWGVARRIREIGVASLKVAAAVVAHHQADGL